MVEASSRFNVIHEPTELDEEAWSRFVLESKQGNIFQTPEMYRVYLGTEGYEPVFTAILDKNKKIVATLLGVLKKEKGSFARRFSNRVLVSGGPIVSDSAARVALYEMILHAHKKYVRKKAIFSEIRNLSKSPELQPYFETLGYRYIPHSKTSLDLTQGIEQLWENLSSKRRQQIRKAGKKGLTICDVSMDDIDDLYILFEETYNRISFPVPSKSLFESILSILQCKNLAKLVGVRQEEKLVSILVNLIYKDVIYAWYCAGSMQYARFHCNEFMFWNAFEWGVKNGYKLFDFGGGGPPDADEDGVRVFKERMGGITHEIGKYECVHARFKHKIATLGFRIWRTIT